MRRVLLAMAVLLAACSVVGNDGATNADHGRLVSFTRLPGVVADATTYRIRYTSVSVSGKRIEVTGLAVVPNAAPPKNGRIVLTTAHGTTGLADACAPSRSARPAEVAAIGGAAVSNGWIVAATDYEGLGTPGRHPYLVGVSEGRSVLDAALAAAALPRAHASRRLLIAGYSQGGHAAAWANQIAPRWTPSLRVLGTFAGAPATEIDRILEAGRTLAIQPFVLSLVAGYAAAYPNADPGRYLTPQGVALLRSVDTGCLLDVGATLRSHSPESLVRAEGPSDPQWLGLARRNNPGSARGAGPVLIVHSDGDDVVPVVLSQFLFDRMCAHHQVVERRVIQGGTHAQAVVPAYFAALTWLRQRVRGMQPVDDCAQTTDSTRD
jgi:dienelactone hydrolase